MPLHSGLNPRVKSRSNSKTQEYLSKREDEKMTGRNVKPVQPVKVTSATVNNHRSTLGSFKSRDIVTLNVGGLRFQTRRSTLRRYPDTLLGEIKRSKHHDYCLGDPLKQLLIYHCEK